MNLWKDKFALGFTAITFLIGLGILLEWIDKQKTPVIQEGILDLSGWDWEKNGIVQLDGEWSFYPDALLTPDDIAGLAPGASFIQVPAKWDGWVKPDGSLMKGKGYGTYRLIIRNAPADQTLAIAKQYVRFSDRLYIDGDLHGESGNPGTSYDSYEPRNEPYTVFFRPKGNEIEILLQAANFDYRSGGIYNSIDFGIGEVIGKRSHIKAGLELMSFGMLTLIGLLFLLLYFWRREQPLLLVFSIFSIAFALTIITNGERLFLQFFSDIPFEPAFKLKYLSVYITPAILLFISWKLMDGTRVKRLLIASIVALLLYSVAIVALPFRMYSLFQELFYGWIFIISIVLVFVLIFQYVKQRFAELDKRQFQMLLAAVWLQVVTNFIVMLNTGGLISLALIHFTSLFFIVSVGLLLIYQYMDAYEAMWKLTRRLQMADRMKDEFLLITSHELNTPLHGVIHISQSLLASPIRRGNERDIRDKLQLIRNTAYRMSNMVKDIIDSARMKDGRLEVRLGTVDLIPCVKVVMEVFGFLADGRNVQLNHRIRPDARYIVADEDRLLQVIYNVIHSILRNRNDTIVCIESEREGEAARISIRISDGGTDEENGSADGAFSIARELVELMGGSFLSGDRTAAANFCFPLDTKESSISSEAFNEIASSYEAASALEGVNGRDRAPLGSKILVASADPVDIEHLYSLLSLEGYSVHCAGSNQEALKCLNGGARPDLAIVDVLLPDSNGYELCRKIRENYNQAELPVLFISARSTPADIEAGIAAGGSDFITRPLDAGEVRVRIHTLLSMHLLVKESAMNEMAFLRSQIKPHFLYNALGTIMSLCYTDSIRAGELLGSFSRYLRIIFHLDNTEETVSLGKEMELIGAYIDIERERFGNRLHIVFDVDQSLYHYRIMPLSIEPLVENAIRHGVSKQVGGGTVRLSIDRQEDLIRVIVEDDGVGMDVEQMEAMLGPVGSGQGVGFRNIVRRLVHLTGVAPAVESELGKGTKVTMWLPMIER